MMTRKQRWNIYGTAVALTGILFSFQNCAQPGELTTSIDSAVNNAAACSSSTTGGSCLDTPVKLVLSPLSDTGFVCEPFGDKPPTEVRNGLKAKLSYMVDTTTPGTYSAFDFFKGTEKYQIVDEPVYFSKINTPTRMFNAGFSTDGGGYLKNSKGEKLIEYFALRYETSLVLAGMPEGTYEFASLSDDGFILEVQENGVWKTLHTKDKPQSTTLNCDAKSRLNLTKTSKVPLRIHYFQGPRIHIASMLLWRKVADDTPLDPECGQGLGSDVVNKYFFDPATSTPLAGYDRIIAHGWSVISPMNYMIPNEEVNPCAFADQDVVKNLKILALDPADPRQNGPDLKVDFDTTLAVSVTVNLIDITKDPQTVVQTMTLAGSSTHHGLILPKLPIKEGTYKLEILMTGTGVKLRKTSTFKLHFE